MTAKKLTANLKTNLTLSGAELTGIGYLFLTRSSTQLFPQFSFS